MSPLLRTVLLGVGALGMIAFGGVELWIQRVLPGAEHSAVLLLALCTMPLLVLAAAWPLLRGHLTRRGTPALTSGGGTRRGAIVGWVLLSAAAVAAAQATLFAGATVMSDAVGCKASGDQGFCGLGSLFLTGFAAAFATGAALIGVVLLVLTRRSARSSRAGVSASSPPGTA